MKAELVKLLALFSDVEESCGCASLSVSTSEGKFISNFLLETQLPPATTTTSSRSLTTRSDEHCDRCGKCEVLCQDHTGCDCYMEEELPLHFAVCCCLRKLPKCPLLVRRLTCFLGVCHLYSLVQDYVVCINNLSKNLLYKNL